MERDASIIFSRAFLRRKRGGRGPQFRALLYPPAPPRTAMPHASPARVLCPTLT